MTVGAPGRGVRAEDQLPLTLSMVIRTEYRDQRYAMGSSDPLPAGFEIRFGSLNFQATGNDYLMRITNREELRARRRPGQPQPLSHLPLGDQRPPARMLRALSASTPSVLQTALSTGANRTPTGCARRITTRRAHRRDDDRPDGGALGLRTAVPPRPARRHGGVRRLRLHRRGSPRGAPCPPHLGGQGPQRLC
jgi:hypothetical protein